MNVKDQIAAARALADACEAGPWTSGGSYYEADAGVVENERWVWVETGHTAGDPYAPDTRLFHAPDNVAKLAAASRTLVPQLADALERACELLAMCDGWISADLEDASHFVELAQVRAFLAGEVKP